MRPQSNNEIAKALRVQSQYATDSETKWLMEEAAKRIDDAPSAELPVTLSAAKGDLSTDQFAEAPTPESQPAEEQKAPPSAKPHRLPRAPKPPKS